MTARLKTLLIDALEWIPEIHRRRYRKFILARLDEYSTITGASPEVILHKWESFRGCRAEVFYNDFRIPPADKVIFFENKEDFRRKVKACTCARCGAECTPQKCTDCGFAIYQKCYIAEPDKYQAVALKGDFLPHIIFTKR